MRALAVIAVILYHSDLLPGGFLGVEIFFVISGYLITTMLLAEWREAGHIQLSRFWLRRARRLLPALFLVITGVLAFSVLFLPGEIAGLRGDALAAAGYVTNWYYIIVQKPYFEAIGRPSLFQHLWSLAVEEQFYLVWPILLAVLLRALKPRRILWVVLAGAALSTLWMAFLYQPDGDPSRVYYGTDTRAAGLLIGAALAFVWTPWRMEERFDWRRAWLMNGLGLISLLALGAACVWLDEYQPLLYRGGFAFVALATAAAIAAATRTDSRLGTRLLGANVLQWIGQRSYSVYLWHWPIFMLTRPQLDVPLDGAPLLVLRIGLTIGLAEISYRWIETPIRSGRLGRAWAAFREAKGARRRQIGARWGGAIATVAILSFALGESVVSAQAPTPPAYLTQSAESASSSTSPSTIALPSPAATSTAPVVPATATATATAPNSGTTATSMPPATAARPVHVYAVGDSVMLGASGELKRTLGDMELDAVVGRQVSAALTLLRARVQLGPVVVIHLGNNGTFTAAQFDDMMGLLANVRRVVIVNVRVTREWANANDAVIAQGIKRYPNAMLVDWNAASANHPEYFYKDGVHLRPVGAQAYAALIGAAVDAP